MRNRVTDNFGTVAGGFANRAGNASGDFDDATSATVSGGQANTARGSFSAVAGGNANTAFDYAFAAGGNNNNAAGIASFAAGQFANVGSHNCAVFSLWGNAPGMQRSRRRLGRRQFVARGQGRLRASRYRGGEVRHIGPMAEDFSAAFEVGYGPYTIANVDARGVALAAIQGLNAKLEAQRAAKDAEIAALRAELADIREMLARRAPVPR